MRRIDFYLQHLTRHRAMAVELVSDQPVVFRFADVDRRSSAVLEHQQLLRLVQEAAPAQEFSKLPGMRELRFLYRWDDGPEFEVEVVVRQADQWQVVLKPTSASEAGRVDADVVNTAPPSSEFVVPSPATRPLPAVSPANAQAGAPPAPLPQSGSAGGGTGAPVPGPSATKPERSLVAMPTVVAGEPRVNAMLRAMQQLGASDLHLSSSVVPMIRLHGDMQPLPGHQKLDDAALLQLLHEIMPERNRREFESVNDSDFAHTIVGVARFRANAFRDRHGAGAVFRVIPFQILSPEALGIPKKILDLCWLTKGLVVVTGPTGSGKSTTLATLIDVINRNRSDHIITIEDPIEFVHDNKKCLLNQREVGTHTGSFKHALRAALREDPDVILVGEMRDLETIAIAIETAETGHLVFGTLHTTTAPSTVDRIIDQFPADRQSQIRVMLSESLRGVIAQVLCKKNGGGRVAAYEVLLTNPAVSNLIREGKTFQLHSVMQTGRRVGMQTLNDHLLEHVNAGTIAAEEAYVKCVNKAHMREALEKAGHKVQLET